MSEYTKCLEYNQHLVTIVTWNNELNGLGHPGNKSHCCLFLQLILSNSILSTVPASEDKSDVLTLSSKGLHSSGEGDKNRAGN